MKVIVANESSNKLSYSKNKIIVKDISDNKLMETNITSIDALLIFGSPQITTQLIKALAKNSIPVFYYSKSGRYLACIEPAENDNFEKQLEQFEAITNPFFSLELARKIIYSKVKLQKQLLEEYDKHKIYGNNRRNIFNNYIKSVYLAQSLEEIMGYEGRAAKSYFHYLNLLLDNDFYMSGRSKRPPKDPFNSLLSFGYSLIYSYIIGMLKKYGLSPGAGVIHQARRKHATLASDIMEEWRVVIIDEVALRCVRNAYITTDMFEKERHGSIKLSKECRNIFIDKIHERMQEKHRYFSQKDNSYTAIYAINLQIQSLMRAYAAKNANLYWTIG